LLLDFGGHASPNGREAPSGRVYTCRDSYGDFENDIVWTAHSHYYHGVVEILERLSPSYWWTDSGTSLDGPLVLAFAIVLGVAFVVAIVAWLLGPRLAPENRLHQRLIVRLAKWVLGSSAVGLLLLLFRWQIVPFFSKRLWLFLWFAAVCGGLSYVVYYWRRIYPGQRAAWEDSERVRRYLPKSGRGGSRTRRRSRRRR
jgi:uncharacterized membrane protein